MGSHLGGELQGKQDITDMEKDRYTIMHLISNLEKLINNFCYFYNNIWENKVTGSIYIPSKNANVGVYL